ncbi:hypothetical protein ACHAXM_003353 [Skeletonema potamos]
MNSSYSAALAVGDDDPLLLSHSRPHYHHDAHIMTSCQTRCQELHRRDAASKVADLQQQREQLLKQQENLLAKNAEQRMKNEELLNQKSNFAKQISDIQQKSKHLNDCKTKTDKAFSRSKTFMILQLEKVTAENEQAVIEEFNRNEELKTINEELFSQLDKLTAENTRLAQEASIINEELLLKSEEILLQSGKLANQISHALEQLEMKKEQISEQLNELARHVSPTASQSHRRGSYVVKDSRHDDIDIMNYNDECCDVMDEYTKCCVCLEPYDVNLTTSCSENRLPIKSATCAHTLCEGCVDNCYASLLTNNRRSNVRYVACPQCRTKRAFDVQNKVVDFFLREYIVTRGKAASKRRVKSKVMDRTLAEGNADTSSSGDLEDSSTVVSLSRREENAITKANGFQANFVIVDAATATATAVKKTTFAGHSGRKVGEREEERLYEVASGKDGADAPSKTAAFTAAAAATSDKFQCETTPVITENTASDSDASANLAITVSHGHGDWPKNCRTKAAEAEDEEQANDNKLDRMEGCDDSDSNSSDDSDSSSYYPSSIGSDSSCMSMSSSTPCPLGLGLQHFTSYRTLHSLSQSQRKRRFSDSDT